MIEQVKVRVDSQLETTLQRLQEVLMDRPPWAEDVATVDGLSEALRNLSRTLPAASDVRALRDVVDSLPARVASPQAVADLKATIQARPAWAGEVASVAAVTRLEKSVGDLAARVAAAEAASLACAGAFDAQAASSRKLAEQVTSLPREVATPAMVEGVRGDAQRLLSEVSGLRAEVDGLRSEVRGVRTTLDAQKQGLADVADTLMTIHAEQECTRAELARIGEALLRSLGENKRVLARLDVPWYRRLFS